MENKYLEQIESQLNILLQNFKHIEYSVNEFRRSICDDSIYNVSLDKIDGIPTRFVNIARNNGITNISELLKITPFDFLKFRGLSARKVEEVRTLLRQKYCLFWN